MPSNATVPTIISLGISTNLSMGVLFGGLTTNTADNNAASNGEVNTTYYIYSADSNTPLDFCVKDDSPLTSSGGGAIGNGNYTFNSSFEPSGPALPGTAISTSHQTLTQQAVGNNMPVYLRFWLDIPMGQPAGVYGNALTFKAIASGTAC